jgi:hypothetical protein
VPKTTTSFSSVKPVVLSALGLALCRIRCVCPAFYLMLLLLAAFLTAILAATTPGILGEYVFALEPDGLPIDFLGH